MGEAERMNEWIKSSFCGSTTCVEVAWQKSSYCGNGTCLEVGWTRSGACADAACVEVHTVADMVHVRDSKNPDQPALAFTHDEWQAFLEGAKAGEFDVQPPTG
jgi:Domain of unknown function (DUF397)